MSHKRGERVSHEKPGSPRLAYKAPVMQAILKYKGIAVVSSKKGACNFQGFVFTVFGTFSLLTMTPLQPSLVISK